MYRSVKATELILVIIAMVLFTNCKDRETPAPPCPTPGFTVQAELEGNGFSPPYAYTLRYFETDTIDNGRVRLIANTEYDIYEWHIGSDARTWATQSVILGFGTIASPTLIEATFIGHRKPRPECIAGDDGIDTVQKTFTVAVKKENLTPRLAGTYRGANQSTPADSFDITIYYGPYLPIASYDAWRIHNSKKGFADSTYDWELGDVTHPAFSLTLGHCDANHTVGVGIVSEDGKTITIDHDHEVDCANNNQNRIKDQFRGRKL